MFIFIFIFIFIVVGTHGQTLSGDSIIYDTPSYSCSPGFFGSTCVCNMTTQKLTVSGPVIFNAAASGLSSNILTLEFKEPLKYHSTEPLFPSNSSLWNWTFVDNEASCMRVWKASLHWDVARDQCGFTIDTASSSDFVFFDANFRVADREALPMANWRSGTVVQRTVTHSLPFRVRFYTKVTATTSGVGINATVPLSLPLPLMRLHSDVANYGDGGRRRHGVAQSGGAAGHVRDHVQGETRTLSVVQIGGADVLGGYGSKFVRVLLSTTTAWPYSVFARNESIHTLPSTLNAHVTLYDDSGRSGRSDSSGSSGSSGTEFVQEWTVDIREGSQKSSPSSCELSGIYIIPVQFACRASRQVCAVQGAAVPKAESMMFTLRVAHLCGAVEMASSTGLRSRFDMKSSEFLIGQRPISGQILIGTSLVYTQIKHSAIQPLVVTVAADIDGGGEFATLQLIGVDGVVNSEQYEGIVTTSERATEPRFSFPINLLPLRNAVSEWLVSTDAGRQYTGSFVRWPVLIDASVTVSTASGSFLLVTPKRTKVLVAVDLPIHGKPRSPSSPSVEFSQVLLVVVSVGAGAALAYSVVQCYRTRLHTKRKKRRKRRRCERSGAERFRHVALATTPSDAISRARRSRGSGEIDSPVSPARESGHEGSPGFGPQSERFTFPPTPLSQHKPTEAEAEASASGGTLDNKVARGSASALHTSASFDRFDRARGHMQRHLHKIRSTTEINLAVTAQSPAPVLLPPPEDDASSEYEPSISSSE